MKNYSTFKRLTLVALVFATAWSLPAKIEERPIWEQEVMLVYSGRATEFNRLRSLGKNNKRLALYTNALDTLHGKIEVEGEEKPYKAALRIFGMIIADNDADAIGLASAYYRARIAQSNPYEQDIEEAKKLYWALYEKWPERFFGQMAFVKYATLHIYDDDGSENEAWERIQNLEPIISDISIPELRQNAHRLMGEAYLGFGLAPELAYEHLLEAYQLGIRVQSIRIEVLEHIATLGEELGKFERALLAYDELLMIDPRHAKAVELAASAERIRRHLGKAAPEEQ